MKNKEKKIQPAHPLSSVLGAKTKLRVVYSDGSISKAIDVHYPDRYVKAAVKKSEPGEIVKIFDNDTQIVYFSLHAPNNSKL